MEPPTFADQLFGPLQRDDSEPLECYSPTSDESVPDFDSTKLPLSTKINDFNRAFAPVPPPALDVPAESKSRPIAGARPFVPQMIPHARTLANEDFGDFDSADEASEDTTPKRSPPSLSRKGTSAIAIPPSSTPIWTALNPRSDSRLDESPLRRRNKSRGKIAINAESKLSSSTEDLLSLAGGVTHLKDKVQLADSPPLQPKESTTRSLKITTFTKPSVIAEPIVPTTSSDPELPFPLDPTLPPPHGLVLPQMVPPGPGVLPGLSPHDSYPQMIQQFNSMTLSPVQSMPPRNLCKFYAAGYCSRGSQCNFLHIDAPALARVVPGPSQPIPPPVLSPLPPMSLLQKSPRAPFSVNPARYSEMTLEESTGQIAMMCLDQHGCRFLQKELDEDEDGTARDKIFGEVLPHIAELMGDPFGNYLCQKLIEKASPEQRLAIVRGCGPALVSISKNMHGTRAVQRLIEMLTDPEEFRVIRESLKGNVVALIQDLNGNHVIQKCLHKMEPNDNQFIYDAVAQHCTQVATHRHGCCVFQRCVDHATVDQKKQLVAEIKNHSLDLVQDAYGNYVVQYVLDLELPNLALELIERLHNKLYFLSRQKFSSNVVEKCLRVGGSRTAIRILREFLFENPDPNSPPSPTQSKEQTQTKLFALLQDSYGNYVVQTCLGEGSIKAPREYLEMANLLRPVVHQLSRNVPYMKRIQSLLSLPTGPIPDLTTPDDTMPILPRGKQRHKDERRMRDPPFTQQLPQPPMGSYDASPQMTHQMQMPHQMPPQGAYFAPLPPQAFYRPHPQGMQGMPPQGQHYAFPGPPPGYYAAPSPPQRPPMRH